MSRTTGEIADYVNGTLEGDPGICIEGVASLDDAGPGRISFLANPRYAGLLATTRAAAVIVNSDWQGTCPAAVIRVANADAAFARVAALLLPNAPPPEPGCHATAVVADGAVLAETASVGPCGVIEKGVRVGARTVIGAGCFVGRGTVIGADTLLYPNVCIREDTEIGDRVIVHMGAVIGSDGFGYVPRDDGSWEKIPQMGIVRIEDDVEIGANVAVDRARFGKTVIAAGAKIDNLVQVAHNVRIGEHTAIAGLVGISGSTSIGRNVRIGGSAGLAGHLHVGDYSVVGAKAGVTKDVPAKTFVSGFPAVPHRDAQKAQAAVRRIPALRKKIAELEQRLKTMEEGRA